MANDRANNGHAAIITRLEDLTLNGHTARIIVTLDCEGNALNAELDDSVHPHAPAFMHSALMAAGAILARQRYARERVMAGAS